MGKKELKEMVFDVLIEMATGVKEDGVPPIIMDEEDLINNARSDKEALNSLQSKLAERQERITELEAELKIKSRYLHQSDSAFSDANRELMLSFENISGLESQLKEARTLSEEDCDKVADSYAKQYNNIRVFLKLNKNILNE